MLRDHRIFSVEFTKMEQERIEDNIGELVGYTQKKRGAKHTVNIVAPSPMVAEAWVRNRFALDEVEIVNVSASKLDAFIHEHTW